MDKQRLISLLPSNPVIFDIGCNDGKDSLEFLNAFPNACIYSFEPDERPFNRFITNCSSNNIHVYKIALGDVDGKIPFYQSFTKDNKDLSGSILRPKEHLLIYPQVSFSDKPIMVRAMTLDTFVKRHSIEHIDFVWSDVQGAEEKLILGGINTFRTKVKYLKTEFSKKELYEGAPTLDKILQLLPEYELVDILWEWEADGDALLKNRNLC